MTLGERFLVHGGSSGIGTMAIQLAVAQGARVFATAGSDSQGGRLPGAGRRGGDQLPGAGLRRGGGAETDGAGVDVVLDTMGAKYLPANVRSLATGGRLVVIGMVGGNTGELNLGTLMAKRATVFAAGLRARPLEQKAAIVAGTVAHVWPLIAAGRVRPVVDRVLPLAEAAEAHRIVEESGHIGKVVLVT